MVGKATCIAPEKKVVINETPATERVTPRSFLDENSDGADGGEGVFALGAVATLEAMSTFWAPLEKPASAREKERRFYVENDKASLEQ